MIGYLVLFGLLAVALGLGLRSKAGPKAVNDTAKPGGVRGVTVPDKSAEPDQFQEQVSELMRTFQGEEEALGTPAESTSARLAAAQMAEAQALMDTVLAKSGASENDTGIVSNDVIVIDTFDPANDVLVIEADDAHDADAEMGVRPSADGKTTVVTLGGTEIARIQTGGTALTADNLRIVIAAA